MLLTPWETFLATCDMNMWLELNPCECGEDDHPCLCWEDKSVKDMS